MSPNQKYSLTEDKAFEWAQTQPTVLNYLSKLNADKQRTAQDIYLYCEWANKTPEELLALKSDYRATEAESLLDRFVRSKVDFPATRKWHITMKVRGFYRANYRELQSAAGKMEYPTGRDLGAPTKEVRRKLIGVCYNPRDKLIVMLPSCSAIALESLGGLRWSHFEENWTTQIAPHISIPSSLVKGHGKGKYRGVRQETFCTTECRELLIEYREWFSKSFGYTWGSNDYVLLQVKKGIGKPLGREMIAKAAVKLAKRAGVSFSVHDGRRIVQTALESVGTPGNWIKKIKGRKCSGEEAPYSKPAIEQLRQKYREALPELEFLSEPKVDVERLEEMEQKLSEKDQVIEALAKNGAELKEKVERIEDSKESLAFLLQKVLELEKKLNEQKNA